MLRYLLRIERHRMRGAQACLFRAAINSFTMFTTACNSRCGSTVNLAGATSDAPQP